jgi:hypothetical protein
VCAHTINTRSSLRARATQAPRICYCTARSSECGFVTCASQSNASRRSRSAHGERVTLPLYAAAQFELAAVSGEARPSSISRRLRSQRPEVRPGLGDSQNTPSSRERRVAVDKSGSTVARVLAWSRIHRIGTRSPAASADAPESTAAAARGRAVSAAFSAASSARATSHPGISSDARVAPDARVA